MSNYILSRNQLAPTLSPKFCTFTNESNIHFFDIIFGTTYSTTS